MGVLMYEEARGRYSCWHFVSYVQERAILPISDVGYPAAGKDVKPAASI